MTRRRNPPSRNPQRPQTKDRDQLDSELRMARANRRAENLQKQKLRRLEWELDPDGDDQEPEEILPAGEDDQAAEDAEEDDSGRSD